MEQLIKQFIPFPSSQKRIIAADLSAVKGRLELIMSITPSSFDEKLLERKQEKMKYKTWLSDKTKQYKTLQDKAIQSNTRQYKTGLSDKTKTIQNIKKQSNTKQYTTVNMKKQKQSNILLLLLNYYHWYCW